MMDKRSGNYRLLCLDLDGTMFPFYGDPDQKCLRRLKSLLRKNQNVLVCYVTGRSLKLALQSVAEHDLPEPSYIITDVGTRIYSKGKGRGWVMDVSWHDSLKQTWPARTSKRVLGSVGIIKGLRKQSKNKQSDLKSSFLLSISKKAYALGELHKKLGMIGAKYTLVLSKGMGKYLLLDILPKGASKENAVTELRKRLGVKTHDTIFAGDSGNDFAMLTSNVNTIVVNNADPDLKRRILRKAEKKATSPTLYFSRGDYDCCHGNDVCGVLEGAIYYRIFSKNKNAGMVIQIHSIHGLVDRNYTDMGRDEDTGGQVVYVVELAKALSELPGVGQVDLITRRIEDPRYPGYGKTFEYINRKFKIVRIRCGGSEYIRKVRLWPHIEEYVKNVMEYVDSEGQAPDIIHANYADAGLAGAMLAERMDSTLVFTGHSLGIPKMQKLGVNKRNYAEFDRRFNFSKRLAAEQVAIDKASAIIVSTRDELENQYSGYRIDRRKFHVMPPGIDLGMFHPPAGPEPEGVGIFKTVTKGLVDTGKPIVLAISRLERRKNLGKLVEVFCKSPALKKAANLVILTGMRNKPGAEQKAIYEDMKATVEKTDSKGSVAFVRFIDSKGGLGALYRMAAMSGGVFINPALIEPFGFTVLEASACGLPVIVTRHGGPNEIITDNVNGLLVEPTEGKQIEAAITKVITDRRAWRRLSVNAIKNAESFSWNKIAKKEMALFHDLIKKRTDERMSLVLDGKNGLTARAY